MRAGGGAVRGPGGAHAPWHKPIASHGPGKIVPGLTHRSASDRARPAGPATRARLTSTNQLIQDNRTSRHRDGGPRRHATASGGRATPRYRSSAKTPRLSRIRPASRPHERYRLVLGPSRRSTQRIRPCWSVNCTPQVHSSASHCALRTPPLRALGPEEAATP